MYVSSTTLGTASAASAAARKSGPSAVTSRSTRHRVGSVACSGSGVVSRSSGTSPSQSAPKRSNCVPATAPSTSSTTDAHGGAQRGAYGARSTWSYAESDAPTKSATRHAFVEGRTMGTPPPSEARQPCGRGGASKASKLASRRAMPAWVSQCSTPDANF